MQVFYSTLSTSKSTQDEDSKKQLHIGRAVIKRIKCLLDENQTNGCDQTRSEPSFGEGLSRVLLDLNAATLRNVMSSTMAHLISCNNGSRLVFSHEFSDFLVGQMEASLEGQDTNVHIRTSKVPDGDFKCLVDSIDDDYIHRPLQKEFEDICFHDMTSQYKKIYNSYKPKSIQTYELSDSHSRHKFCHLSKLKHSTIPRIALPQNKLCSLEELEFQHTNSTEILHYEQEMYAKMALLMFHPYQKLNDMTDDGSYWKKFI